MRFLVEIEVMNPATVEVETLYLSSGGREYPPFYPTDTLRPNKYYEPLVQDVNGVSLDIFPKGATSGQSSLGSGVVTLNNTDGRLDYLMNYGYTGRPIKVYYGSNNIFSDYTLYFSGVVDTIDFTYTSDSSGSLKVTVRDKKKILDKDISTNVYLGTNVGSTGNEGTMTSGLYNKQKPLCFGLCLNITPISVNDPGLRYQVHDGQIYDIPAVYDNGVALTYSTNPTPPAGNYYVNKTTGIFTLGSKPAGTITCDVQGATPGGIYLSTFGAIANYIVTTYGGLTAGDIDSTTITELDSLLPYTVGLYLSGADKPKVGELSSNTVRGALDTLVQDSLVYWVFDIAGKFSMGTISPPDSQISLQTLDKYSIITLELLQNSDTNQGVPCGRLNLNAVQNYTTQTSGLAGSVTNDRIAWLKLQYREFLRTSTANITIYNADLVKVVKTSTISVAADAEDLATMLMDFYSIRRMPYKVILDIKQLDPAVRPTKVVTIKFNRFGMDSGKKFLVMGMAYNTPKLNQVELTVYG